MESITSAANAAATTVKNTIWGQSTATDTDTSGRADSHAQRSVDPTSATREVTSDTYERSSGSKFGAGSTGTPMKHEIGQSSGLDTSRDTNKDNSSAHQKSEPFSDTLPTAPILSAPLQPTSTEFDSTNFNTSSKKPPTDTTIPTSPFDTEVQGHTTHQTLDAPMSDTASTDEVRSGYSRIYPDSASKTTDTSSHHGQHKSEAAGAVGAATLGTGLGPTHDKNDTPKTSSTSGSSPADELHSVNAPPGPTGTEVKVTDTAQTNTRIPTAGVPGMPVSKGPSSSMSPGGHISGAQPSKATDTANAAPASVQHTMTGSGPGTAVEPSVSSAHPGITPQKQGADRPMKEPGTSRTGNVIDRTTSHEQEHYSGDSSQSNLDVRRKSEPLVRAPQPGELASPGLPSKIQLSGDHGTGEGTGTKYERSTGLAAEGGDFDASRPGAGKEADRLLDEHNVEHGKAMGRPGQHVGDAHGHEHKFGFGHHEHHEQHPAPVPGERRGSSGKTSLGEKIKEKLHIGGHGKQH